MQTILVTLLATLHRSRSVSAASRSCEVRVLASKRVRGLGFKALGAQLQKKKRAAGALQSRLKEGLHCALQSLLEKRVDARMMV